MDIDAFEQHFRATAAPVGSDLSPRIRRVE
jgi:hypothetical protein